MIATFRKVRAFTLAEIVVVLALTSIVAILLYPIIGKARENLQYAGCMSHQQQLAMALLQYAEDHQSKLPGQPGVIDSGMSWHNAVKEAGGSSALFACPSIMRDGSVLHPCYGFNGHLNGVYMYDVHDPSRVMTTADAHGSVISASDDFDATRHRNRYIASFLDGHVAAFPLDNNRVIFTEGEEGDLLAFGATGIPIGFAAGNIAVGVSKIVDEGATVQLLNQANESITAEFTMTGAQYLPWKGLCPGVSNVTIGAGKCKVFTLYCGFGALGCQKVDTNYQFGDDQHAVVITVRRPTVW